MIRSVKKTYITPHTEYHSHIIKIASMKQVASTPENPPVGT